MEDAIEQTEHFEQVILDYVKSFAIVEPDQVIPRDQSLLEAGILDSFGIVEMITFIESEFDIAIPDEDMTKEKLGSIQKMAEYIKNSKT